LAGGLNRERTGVRRERQLQEPLISSKPWVTAPGRMSDTDAMLAASCVWTANVAPYGILIGALVMIGRAPLNRYGGRRSPPAF